MIICRCKETNKLEEVYAGFYEFIDVKKQIN